MSWYYYLEEKLEFPFKARCVASRTISPLEERQEKRSIRNVTPTLALPRRGGGCREKKGEEVEVLGMAPGDECMKEMFAIVGFAGRKLGVPLSQLKVLETGRETREAIEDWQYWVAMGYEF